MNITEEMIEQYVKSVYEKNKDGSAPWAYIAGVLQSQLTFALKGEMQRKIVEETILEEIANAQ
jgi:hypothetical protein